MEAWRRQMQEQLRENLREWDEEQNQLEAMMRDDFVIWGPREAEDGRRRGIRRRRKNRGRQARHDRLYNDYFGDNPVYYEEDFRRRFCMTKRLFLRILDAIPRHDNYFVQQRDAANVLGLSTLQRVVAAMRQLAYGIGADATDEYCRIGESTARESLYRFCRAIRELYGEHYLRKPIHSDLTRILEINAARGFPGMFGSLDCMHYEWSNCPVAWQGAYENKDREKSIVLEAVADGDLHFWHAFFGLPGGNNDKNVLARSPLINEMILGAYNEHTFQLGSITFRGPFLLVDGIYPPYSCFVHKSLSHKVKKQSFLPKSKKGYVKMLKEHLMFSRADLGLSPRQQDPDMSLKLQMSLWRASYCTI